MNLSTVSTKVTYRVMEHDRTPGDTYVVYEVDTQDEVQDLIAKRRCVAAYADVTDLSWYAVKVTTTTETLDF